MPSRTCSHCLRNQHALCTAGEACECETCNPSPVTWEDPPPVRRGRPILTDEQIAALKEHPKRWAKIRAYDHPNSANGAKTNYRAGKTTVEPGFEFESRKNGKGSVLYARWVGTDDEAAA